MDASVVLVLLALVLLLVGALPRLCWGAALPPTSSETLMDMPARDREAGMRVSDIVEAQKRPYSPAQARCWGRARRLLRF